MTNIQFYNNWLAPDEITLIDFHWRVNLNPDLMVLTVGFAGFGFVAFLVF